MEAIMITTQKFPEWKLPARIEGDDERREIAKRLTLVRLRKKIDAVMDSYGLPDSMETGYNLDDFAQNRISTVLRYAAIQPR